MTHPAATITLPAPTDPATDAAYGIVAIYEMLDRPEPAAFASWLRKVADDFDGMDAVGTVEGRA